MYIPVGSRLTYTAEYEVTLLSKIALMPGDILSEVTSDLSNNHNIVVESSGIDNSIFNLKTSFTLKLKTNDGDHGSEDDVRSIVDHYFFTETGNFPAASRISNVTVPNAAPVSTGAPPSPPVDSNPSTSDGSIVGSIGDTLGGVVDTLKTGSVGVVLGIGLVIGLGFIIAAKEGVA